MVFYMNSLSLYLVYYFHNRINLHIKFIIKLSRKYSNRPFFEVFFYFKSYFLS